mgnify:CR=1 FL=1
MKLTKSALRQMIKEENDRIKLQQKAMGKGKQAAQLRQQASGVQKGEIGGDFTPIERSLVQQISQVITDIASAPDVDLGKYKAQLNTVMNRLKNLTGAELGGGESEEAAAEEEQLEEGATSFDPEPRREAQQGEIEVMKGRGKVQKWFYLDSAQDAQTLVRLGRSWGFPTGITQNLSGEAVPQGFYIPEER